MSVSVLPKRDRASAGKGNGSTPTPVPLKVGRLDSTGSCRREAARVYRDVRTAQLDPKTGTRLVYMLDRIAKLLELERADDGRLAAVLDLLLVKLRPQLDVQTFAKVQAAVAAFHLKRDNSGEPWVLARLLAAALEPHPAARLAVLDVLGTPAGELQAGDDADADHDADHHDDDDADLA